MKLIQLGLLLLITNAFSQKHHDLYIIYSDENLDNRIVLNEQNEMFQVSIPGKASIGYALGFDESGKIQVQNVIPGLSSTQFKFTYSNENGENPVKKVTGKEITEALDFTEMTYLTDADNFYKTLQLYENIYFIHRDMTPGAVLLAKKVKMERIAGM